MISTKWFSSSTRSHLPQVINLPVIFCFYLLWQGFFFASAGLATFSFKKAEVRCWKRATSQKGNNLEGWDVTDAETLLQSATSERFGCNQCWGGTEKASEHCYAVAKMLQPPLPISRCWTWAPIHNRRPSHSKCRFNLIFSFTVWLSVDSTYQNLSV